jgi:hypothetical protein
MTSQIFNPSPDATALQVNNLRKSTSEPLVSSTKMGRSRLGADFEPSNHSVICGRGKDSFNHVGNQRFRILTSMFLERYSQNKSAKSAIVSHIVAMIRLEGGDFCRYDKGASAWFEVGDHWAREKVSALLRDLLHTKYRSSSKAKIARRRARKQSIKQIELFDQQLVEGTEDSDDCSSISSLCWGSSMDSLGGESALEDGLGFDIDVF